MEDLLIRLNEAKNIISEAIEYFEQNKPPLKNKCLYDRYCEHQNCFSGETLCTWSRGELCSHIFQE